MLQELKTAMQTIRKGFYDYILDIYESHILIDFIEELKDLIEKIPITW